VSFQTVNEFALGYAHIILRVVDIYHVCTVSALQINNIAKKIVSLVGGVANGVNIPFRERFIYRKTTVQPPFEVDRLLVIIRLKNIGTLDFFEFVIRLF